MKRLEIDEITDWFVKNHFPNTMASCMTETVCLFIEEVEKLRKENVELFNGLEDCCYMFRWCYDKYGYLIKRIRDDDNEKARKDQPDV